MLFVYLCNLAYGSTKPTANSFMELYCINVCGWQIIFIYFAFRLEQSSTSVLNPGHP